MVSQYVAKISEKDKACTMEPFIATYMQRLVNKAILCSSYLQMWQMFITDRQLIWIFTDYMTTLYTTTIKHYTFSTIIHDTYAKCYI